MPAFLDRVILLKSLAYSPQPKIILDWFKKNKPEFFPLAEYECYALANGALSKKKPEIFNEIILLCVETNVTHFPFILERDNLKTCMKNFNIALADNFCIETISIQRDYNTEYHAFFRASVPEYDMTCDPVYLDVCDKLKRNKALKAWSTLSLMIIAISDDKSSLFGMCLDLFTYFSSHLVALYVEFGSHTVSPTLLPK